MFAKKNIYDRNGRLLLSEGQQITKKMRERLEHHQLLREEALRLSEQDRCESIKQNLKEVCKKLNLCEEKLLNYPASIVSKIIFESKAEPWWYVINTLYNHIGWVYTHSINVSLIAVMIGIKSGFCAQALFEIALGSLLHDVGKLMLPKSLIQKKGSLTDEEMILMKQHCELGVSITAEFGLPQTCSSIILQHHERNNGNGYPLGLKEKDIHSYSEIVMIADVLDAMTSYRPYRPAKEMPTALKLLKEDEVFSKELVAVLEELLQ